MSDDEEATVAGTGGVNVGVGVGVGVNMGVGIGVGVGVSVGVPEAASVGTTTDDVPTSSEPSTPVTAVNASTTTTPTTASAGTGTTEDNIIQQGDDDPNKPQWPSMVDLNTRLRKVINSYQRNFKKEETKLLQKAKVKFM